MYFNKFPIIYVFQFTVQFTKWKTGNHLKIHLFHSLADKYEYIYDSFVVVLSQKSQEKSSQEKI